MRTLHACWARGPAWNCACSVCQGRLVVCEPFGGPMARQGDWSEPDVKLEKLRDGGRATSLLLHACVLPLFSRHLNASLNQSCGLQPEGTR